MNRPCIITIIGITRGKRVARRKTFNKWPFRISPIFFFFPFLSLSVPREVIPERKKGKKWPRQCSIVRLFDCSIASPSYFIEFELTVAVPFSSRYLLFFNVFFFFFWIPLRFFFRLVIKCFYKHNNSFFFLLLVISRNRESL